MNNETIGTGTWYEYVQYTDEERDCVDTFLIHHARMLYLRIAVLYYPTCLLA
jgi:hypothetical protein